MQQFTLRALQVTYQWKQGIGKCLVCSCGCQNSLCRVLFSFGASRNRFRDALQGRWSLQPRQVWCSPDQSAQVVSCRKLILSSSSFYKVEKALYKVEGMFTVRANAFWACAVQYKVHHDYEYNQKCKFSQRTSHAILFSLPSPANHSL